MFADREARINLVIATFLWRRLSRRDDLEVSMTRTDDLDVSLGERLGRIRSEMPDAFVSIHCNAYHNPQATGMEVLYADLYDVGLADSILNAMHHFLRLRNRGLKMDKEWLGHSLAVLKDLKTPSCLVECGFITNPVDYFEVIQYDRVAEAIERGILDFFGFSTSHAVDGHPV